MSAASLSPAFDFVISHPDRAPTVRSEALREDPETGFEEFLSLLGLDPETAVPEYSPTGS